MIGPFIHSLVYCFVLASVFGCSNQRAKSTISIQFQEKSNSALAVKIQHLIINVSGSSLPLTVFEYDCEVDDCTKVSFELSSGSHLIQLLVVTEDGTGMSRVNYGDVLAQLKGGDNNIEIAVVEKGTFRAEGKISGRYIPKVNYPMADKYLTGTVSTHVAIGGGKPDMRITNSEIFGGWFNAFILDGVPFKFKFTGFDASGKSYFDMPLFSDLHGSEGMRLSSAGIAATNNTIVHYYSNLDYFDERDSSTFVRRLFERKILGFFGQNPSNRYYCANPISGSTVFDGMNGRGRICKTIDGPAATTCSNFFQYSDISVAGTPTSCGTVPPAPAFAIDLNRMGYNEEFAGTYGPFTKWTSNGQSGFVHIDNTTSTIKWQLHPNVYLPHGVEVFVRTQAANFNTDEIRDRFGDGIACEKLTEHQFVSIGSAVGASGTKALSTAQINSGNLVAVLCPKKSGTEYYRTAKVHYGGFMGGGTPAKIALGKAAQINGNTNKLYNGVCYPYIIEVQTANNQPAHLMTPQTFNLVTSKPGPIAFYGNLDACMGNTPLAPQEISLTGRAVVYLKTTLADGLPESASIVDPSNTLIAGTTPIISTTRPNASTLRLVPDFHRASLLEVAHTESCVPFQVARMSAENELTFNTISAMAEITGTFSVGSTAIQYYSSESACKTGSPQLSSSLALASDQALDMIWIKYTNGSAGTLQNVIRNCSGGYTCVTTNVPVVAPGAYTHSQFRNFGGVAEVNGCLQMSLAAFDNHYPNAYPVPIPGMGTISIADSGDTAGTFFYYSPGQTCGASLPSLNPSIGIGYMGYETELKFMYQPGRTGFLELDADVNGTAIESAPIPVSYNGIWGRVEIAEGSYDDMGQYNSTYTKVYNITNLSSMALVTGLNVYFEYTTGNKIGFAGGVFPGLVGSPLCSVNMNYNYDCQIQVAFTPNGTPSTEQNVMWIEYNGGDGNFKTQIVIRAEEIP